MSDYNQPVIIIPPPHVPQKSAAELADEKAKELFDDEPRREAFRMGARFERTGDFSPKDIVPFIFAMYVFAQFIFFICGVVANDCDWRVRKDVYELSCFQQSKWVYVAPGYGLGGMFSRWMSK